MKKLMLFLMLTVLLSGCSLLNLSNVVLPDDINFINTVKELDTPEKICSYMKDNFVYKPNVFSNLEPYQLWLNQEGDCNDFAAFAMFVANYHNYTTYLIHIHFKGMLFTHVLAVYVENGKYTYSNNKAYYPIGVSSFYEIVSDYFDIIYYQEELSSYEVYDYDMNLIETYASL
jgi:hypothetical protein